MVENVAFGAVETPLGKIAVAVTDAGLATVVWGDTPGRRESVARRLGLAVAEGDPDGRTEGVLAELSAYFAGDLRAFSVPVDWRLLSPVQRGVLGTLHGRVPYGKAVTYGELAAMSGTGVPARAIGSIMGANPIPIVVPCHRVVAGDGLGGFSGGTGVEDKRWLLTLEGYLQPMLDWDI
ncbi:methylated-DNA--[protein]-cysteine S-methyltransferase [Spongiactinospora sp. TRM90649]|uniref:methylated-DNA--[protein]-cysteine S-methyltransferase n=1 Tax=Spongiactinospora sp. TRM90649 TaxID=3031114 RepID=UPI0023F82A70|nr:methylated-DNA--[protein]-cysteine S-methyltransferase [Spongiactinospora sp. TRM90649]MDF5754067.1 methylated-DNA--[protein]-cysteine S-methyltransferase [Spongiactinospora sp. TRM90649]